MSNMAPTAKRMQPLPPIEQYNVYSNAYAQQNHSLPMKQAVGGNHTKMTSGFTASAAPKRERDAMVADIFAKKKSMSRDIVGSGVASHGASNGFNQMK